ncbi:MAG: Ribosomal small subunit pseudouridine synthase [Pseudomonadota bacterium]|jgi:16S rRNA pseudouridine516 synthase
MAKGKNAAKPQQMYLDELLFSQGFGTRRVCAGLIEQGLIQVWQGDAAVDAPEADTVLTVSDPAQPDLPPVRVRLAGNDARKGEGLDWPYAEHACILLNKPAGYECSQKPGAWPSIYTLLPAPLRQRPHKNGLGVQAIGRLDQDTTGLLLLTDDGQLIHRMASPKHHVPKIYQVGCKHPVTQAMVGKLLTGVVLEDDPRPVKAAACETTGELSLALTLTEGKYHQVKRMIAAVGNRVETLHRSQIGRITLPADLQPGQWMWIDPAQI